MIDIKPQFLDLFHLVCVLDDYNNYENEILDSIILNFFKNNKNLSKTNFALNFIKSIKK